MAAWLRRDGDRAVLVVANLGAKPLTGVSLASADSTLRAGRWTTRALFGGTTAAAALRVGADGKVARYVPLRTLAPRRGYLFELSAPAAPRTSTR